MAITQVDVTKQSTATGTSVTIDRPASVVEGDILIAAITTNGNAITAPSNWTNWDGLNGNADLDPAVSWQTQLYWKLATGSEPSSYTWTMASNPDSAGFGGFVQAWRGVDPVSPIDGSIDTIVTQALNANVGSSSPSVTVASSAGRVMVVRCVRRTSNGGATGSYSTSTSGASVHVTVNALSGSGNTLYALGMASYGTEYTTSGVKSGITTALTLSQTNNYRATFALKAATPAEGGFTTSLGKVSATFAGERELPQGPIAAQLPKVSATFTATGEPPNGGFAAGLPKVSAALSGGGAGGGMVAQLPSLAPAEFAGAVNPIGGFAGQLPSITSSFLSETAVYGEHVIRVEKDHRAFRVIDDGTDVGLKAIKRSQVTQQ